MVLVSSKSIRHCGNWRPDRHKDTDRQTHRHTDTHPDARIELVPGQHIQSSNDWIEKKKHQLKDYRNMTKMIEVGKHCPLIMLDLFENVAINQHQEKTNLKWLMGRIPIQNNNKFFITTYFEHLAILETLS